MRIRISLPEVPALCGAYTTERIKRKDAEAVHKSIRPLLKKFSSRYEMAGSYRRGKADMGDIDFILADGDLTSIVAALMNKGVIFRIGRHGDKTATVVMKNGKKECQVEFSTVPSESFGAALMHSTGSAAFNMQLRTNAKQKGLLLNQYGLYAISSKKLIAGKTEEDIFKALGYKLIPPTDRDEGFWSIKDRFKVKKIGA